MSIEEEINIRTLDPRKLDDLARKTLKDMEGIRKRLEAEAKKADKAVNQVNGPAQDILNQQAGRTGTPGKILTQSGLVQGLAPAMRKSTPWLDLKAQVKANTENQSKLEKGLGRAIQSLLEVQAGINDPIGLLFGAAKKRLPLNLIKGGIIGTLIIAIAQQVLEEYKNTFKPGGINDIRKMVLDEASTIPDLENLIAVRNGSVFFTSDVRVRQKVAQSSNTESLDSQSQRFNELSLGRDITT